MSEIPKNIWIYWDKRIENAPEVVKICVESWIKLNPDWKVNILNANNLSSFVNMDDILAANPKITIQAFSDSLRWRLIHRYGGVWVDSTVYCNVPLSKWLPHELCENNSFLFLSNRGDLFFSWFIAATLDSHLVSGMNFEMNRFLVNYTGFRHYMDIRFFWRFFKVLELSMGTFNYEFWRLAFVRKYIKASPYFFQNYLLGALLKRNKAVAFEFMRISNKFGNTPHALQECTHSDLFPSKNDILSLLSKKTPLFKLTYKRYYKEWSRGAMFFMLNKHIRASTLTD